MYLPRPAVAGRRVWDRRSGLLLRVGRRWMVLAASIVDACLCLSKSFSRTTSDFVSLRRARPTCF